MGDIRSVMQHFGLQFAWVIGPLDQPVPSAYGDEENPEACDRWIAERARLTRKERE